MERILIVTVGGSAEPIITSINMLKPLKVYFVASKTSQALISREISPEISDKVMNEIHVLKYEDDVISCYREIVALIEKIQGQNDKEREILVDYSGGTKSMTAAAVLAAVRLKCRLVFEKGVREDLVQVVSGTQLPEIFSPWDMYEPMILDELRELASLHFYGAIVERIIEIEPFFQEEVVKERFKIIKNKALALESWEKFDHQTAKKLLSVYSPTFENACQFLESIDTGYGYVFDLVANANRRFQQGRYDDSCARLYRSLEMMAQIRLRETYSLNSSNLRYRKLPPSIREKYQLLRGDSGKIQLSLRKSYQLLHDLGDALGKLYIKKEATLKEVLDLRNYSILAHGDMPIKKGDYIKVEKVIANFLKEGCKAIKIEWIDVPFPRLIGD